MGILHGRAHSVSLISHEQEGKKEEEKKERKKDVREVKEVRR